MGETLKQIFLSGAVVNFFGVIIGSLVGILFKKGIPFKVKDTLVKGMALCVLYIGVTGMFEENTKPLVILISMALGAVVGEAVDFDKRLNRLGESVEKRFKQSNSELKITEGFVSATMLFCVGAMTVVGSIDSGVMSDNTTLYSKTLLDTVSSVALASTLGVGVMLAAVAVLIIEGGLTLLAMLVGPMLSADVITQMSVTGSLLIVALGLNLLGLTKIKVMNYLPAIFLPLVLCLVI